MTTLSQELLLILHVIWPHSNLHLREVHFLQVIIVQSVHVLMFFRHLLNQGIHARQFNVIWVFGCGEGLTMFFLILGRYSVSVAVEVGFAAFCFEGSCCLFYLFVGSLNLEPIY